MQIGIDSFARTAPDALTGQTLDPADRLSNLLEEITVAEHESESKAALAREYGVDRTAVYRYVGGAATSA